MAALSDPDVLETPLETALGSKHASALKKAFGFFNLGDFLSHYPRRYARRGELTAISDIPLDENVTLVAEILDVRERPMRARKGSLLEVRITDGRSGGIVTLTFFNQAWRAQQLKPGMQGIFAGKVSAYKGSLQLAHPDYELFDADTQGIEEVHNAKKWALQPIPIYGATNTLASWQIAKLMSEAVRFLLAHGGVGDPVPEHIRKEEKVLTFTDALVKIHHPEVDSDWKKAQETLRFHEAFVLQATLVQQYLMAEQLTATARPAAYEGYLAQLDTRLPFTLTADQQLVGEEISSDIEQTHPMNRLVQGEVGSGKTLVALRAMLQVADSGGQAVLLAPTEVLAAQHLRSIVSMLGPDLSASMMPTLVTGQLPAAQKRQALLRVVSGQARIVIGTHALLSDNVEFFDLALVVVDEQHRFGVEQRQALKLKASTSPHVLVLTATPIPRTVAMTVFGDLDVSVIATLPEGRAGITSHAVTLADHPHWISRVWERVNEEIELGRQAFVVCPAIDAIGTSEDDGEDLGDDTHEKASVESVMTLLQTHPALSQRRIAALHGRMSSDEKDHIMQAFARGEIDVLVATTVIEVGVDVPNASTMVVMDADRFGISQLHQLRGRVGRGGIPGLALFVTSAAPGTPAYGRVNAVASTLDGFELAHIDLEIRSEGNVLGTRQSGGRSSLRLLRVLTDAEVIVRARAYAQEICVSDPTLADHPDLAIALARRLDESEREFLTKN